MTEAEWLAAADPEPMLDWLRGRVSDHKLRRFAVACCCRIGRLLTDQRSVSALLAADRFLDGGTSPEELQRTLTAARQAYENAFQNNDSAAYSMLGLGAEDGYQAAVIASENAADALTPEGADRDIAERTAQAELLRHFFGDPFHVYPAPEFWPATVVDLARAIGAGQDCHFALHDALLEAGHPQLAEHFQEAERHPKGCWALDLVLGKS